MQRCIVAMCGLMLLSPTLASATTLSLAGGSTNIELPIGFTTTVNLVLTDVTSNYTDSNLRISINGGVAPAPIVTNIFGVSATSIPVGNLAGSIWSQGGVGPAGVEPVAAFNTNAFIPQQTAGLYATLTIHTPIGTAPGVYSADLSATDLINGLNPDFEPIFVDLNTVSFTIHVGPEPSSVVLGLLAAAGLGVVIVRRRRAPNTISC